MAKNSRRGLPAHEIQNGLEAITRVEKFLDEIAVKYPPKFDEAEPYGAANAAANALKNLREVLTRSLPLILFVLLAGCDAKPAATIEPPAKPDSKIVEPTAPDSNSEPDSLTPSDQYEAKIVTNSDGDSCTVLTDENKQIVIRLHGIDCPERGQPYGRNATKALRAFVGKRVRVVDRGDAGWDRRAADLYVVDSDEWINLALVQQGWAWHSAKFSQDERLRIAHDDAKQSKRGLWAMQDGRKPPWEWRQLSKEERDKLR